jgi:hypothetical protein
VQVIRSAKYNYGKKRKKQHAIHERRSDKYVHLSSFGSCAVAQNVWTASGRMLSAGVENLEKKRNEKPPTGEGYYAS